MKNYNPSYTVDRHAIYLFRPKAALRMSAWKIALAYHNAGYTKYHLELFLEHCVECSRAWGAFPIFGSIDDVLKLFDSLTYSELSNSGVQL